MTDLAIARWRTRYRAARPPAEADRRAWDEAPHRLRAPPAVADTEAIVCIRRIAIAARVREGVDGTARLAALLGEALEARIAAALRDATPASAEAVVWRDRREALADMLYRAASGDLSRAWAWRQAGLLPATGAADAASARAAAVTALAAEPGLAWSVLARLVLAEAETGSLAVLLARLDRGEWRALLGGAGRGAATPAAEEPGAPPAAEAAVAPRDAVGRALLAYATARPVEATRHRDTLVLLLARAFAGGAAPAGRHLRAAEAALGPAAPAAMPRAPRPGPTPPGEVVAAPLPPVAEAEADGADPAVPPAPPLPAPEAPLRTEWGGVLFLLPLLPPAGLLEALAGTAASLPEALAGTAASVPEALLALGLALGVPPDDPALRAFCGGVLPDPAPLPETLVPGTIAATEALLRGRLGAPEDRDAWLPDLCRRDALLSIEPGWIEAEFPLDSADPRLRRGAIDLDPGHLPWLGCVVRFRYA